MWFRDYRIKIKIMMVHIYLSTRDPNVDIEVVNKKKSPYKFSGGIFGDREDVIGKITKFSDCFRDEKFNHNIKLFDSKKRRRKSFFLEHENPKEEKEKDKKDKEEES